ncbi:Ger(x)C family spore germination C-terminal domain-containing protein [Paenibacillus sp. OK003]|uniref:Ger(x)C family spore germination protein n=1 Tax=Paenibacillus sp. OK003 TaxID=1884380 RepID=UPI0008B89606|nr:Ger(x)C family spore germination C-terminal domain-containing protein [Paenibacillus sp. OK003]SEK96469.1 germination protein, Ger(x)C family [Paenibacillus sp. OK003]
MTRFQPISKCSLLLIFIFPLLTGCWDRLDPENMAFIMAVGVDPGPQNDYIYTFAVAMPKSNSSMNSESKSESKSIVNVFSQEGASLSSAMLTSQSYVARRLTLIHSKAFILGDGVAREGIMPVIGEVVRNSEFRRTVNVITTKGRADRYIQNIKPVMEDDIDLWFELEMDPHNTGAITPKRSRFHDFILDIEQPGTGGTTILSAARPDVEKGSLSWDKEESSLSSKEEPPITSNTYAGNLPRKGETPIDFFGSAVYRGQKLVGYLTALETKTLNILRGEFEETVMEFHDPVDPKYNLTISMDALKKNPLTLTHTDDQINVSLSPHMVGELIGSMSKVDYTSPENMKLLENSVQEQLTSMASELLDKTLYTWNVDCVHIGNRLRATFPTLQEWYAYKWREHIKETKYHLDIRFRMKRHGDQVGPAVEGDEMKK